LEETNEAYALAKIAGLKWRAPIAANTVAISSAPCRAISYGPGDKHSLEAAHVLPALIRKAPEASWRVRRR
jgi:GDP-L-fucose synthase